MHCSFFFCFREEDGTVGAGVAFEMLLTEVGYLRNGEDIILSELVLPCSSEMN